ncbi:MAG: restriction endonuclease [Proteobacteria bacterium]|nr:restriction endonuclease [Pseudomonadota bacterium]
MYTDKITDYFDGVAAKYLSAVDADPARSNGHEIGGLPSAGARNWLGIPSKGEVFRYPALHVYLADDQDEPLICDSEVTWYDARSKQPGRSPEYRMYYEDSPVTMRFKPGDFFLVAKHRDGRLLMCFSPQKSAAEKQLRAIFGLSVIDEDFRQGDLNASTLLLPLRLMLESLGFNLSKPALDDGAWLDRLLAQFGDKDFPRTDAFSMFARDSIGNEIDAIASPDTTLMAWMEHEEKLFRIYERYFVLRRLAIGFGIDEKGVDAFISYSLSVQNRRKSRVGHAFEGHLGHLFQKHDLQFEKGTKVLVTENNTRPDFLFPSFMAYHDASFPTERLLMLGAKTTCKDRWRQVLSEASRIPAKHLVTLEPAISEAQTDEMKNHQLQLVVPRSLHSTFSERQQSQLLDVAEFISLVKINQKAR